MCILCTMINKYLLLSFGLTEGDKTVKFFIKSSCVHLRQTFVGDCCGKSSDGFISFKYTSCLHFCSSIICSSFSLSEQSNITFNHGKSLFFFRYSSDQFYCRLDILFNLVILTKKQGEARGGGVHHFSGSYTHTFNHPLTSLEY